MPITKTPLRYPGGKSRFSPYIKRILEVNCLQNGNYIEPYAGGAGVALELLKSGYVKRIHINDYDLAIYNFWKAITSNTEEFLKLLVDTDVSIEQWQRQKTILDSPIDHSRVEHGFAAFFLNRTNRSGILKGGVIGGKAQNGQYSLADRFNKNDLSKKIVNIAQLSKYIRVSNLDAVKLLKKYKGGSVERSVIYLDPPYYLKGQGLYRNYYKHEDHVEIMNTLKEIKTSWIVSYDNCPEIRSIYKGFRQFEYKLSYTAQQKRVGSEVIIYSDNLEAIPFSA